MTGDPMSLANNITMPENAWQTRYKKDKMILDTNMKFDFDDVLIQPASSTYINSRYKEIYPYLNGKLPLFTAPMDTVVGSQNARVFSDNRINIVYPRTEKYKKHVSGFNSFGLDEFELAIKEMSPNDGSWRVLIDVANGHMQKIVELAVLAKQANPNIIIMAGNIANPETYRTYCYSKAIDYARIGIGNGNGCLTTQQTGIGYPMGSLISECYLIKLEVAGKTKIVADGGMKKYSDIIKAIALGADYVMVGSLFNKALESAAPNYWMGIKLPENVAGFMFDHGFTIKKEFRGMSSKKSQVLLGNRTLRTSEGITRTRNVEYRLKQWTDNFESYLRSAMSYCDCTDIKKFTGYVRKNIITQNAYNRYNK